jgi:hypothetical protein
MRLASKFQVRAHTLCLFTLKNFTWVVVIDDTRLPGTFMTQAEAWTAGVREADRIDRASGEPVL